MAQPRQIPTFHRMGYGCAEIGLNAFEVLIRVSLLIFYTDVVGLKPHLAGYAIAIGVLWDAVTDPFMGQMSDRTSFRGQRRRPYFIPGAILLGIGTILLFNVPAFDSQVSKFLYLLAVYCCANTAMTILAIPLTALAGDMTTDSEVRKHLFGWRMFFTNVGLTAGTALPGIVASWGQSKLPVDSVAAYGVAAIILISTGITLRVTRTYDRITGPPPEPRPMKGAFRLYIGQLVEAISNRKFQPIVMAYTTATVGLTLNSSLAMYYYRYRLLLEPSSVRALIAFFMLIFCLAIPLWVWAARFWSKHAIMMVNISGLGILSAVTYPFFPPHQMLGPMVTAVFGGIFVGAAVLMEVVVAEVVDEGSLNRQAGDKSGNHFGLYFGLWRMAAKASRAIALVLTGHLLTWIGFEAGQPAGPETSQALGWLFGPGVGFTFIMAGVILAMTRHRYKS